MKTQKVNIDEVARHIPSLFESTGENEFQVDTEQFGIVTVTIGLRNDEVFFEARDQTGTLVPTKYLDGYVGPWNLVVNEFRRFRPKGINRGEGKSPFGLEITPAESTSPLWIPNRSRLEIEGEKFAFVRQGFPPTKEPSGLLCPFDNGKFETRPQVLHFDDLETLTALGRHNPSLLVWYNGGEPAGGTVTQNLHGQVGIIRRSPIDGCRSAQQNDHGVRELKDYPAVTVTANTSTDLDSLWRMISRMQNEERPFNLLIRENHAFLAGRTKKISASLPGITIAALEVAGIFICERTNLLDRFTPESIAKALHDVTLPLDELRKYYTSTGR